VRRGLTNGSISKTQKHQLCNLWTNYILKWDIHQPSSCYLVVFFSFFFSHLWCWSSPWRKVSWPTISCFNNCLAFSCISAYNDSTRLVSSRKLDCNLAKSRSCRMEITMFMKLTRISYRLSETQHDCEKSMQMSRRCVQQALCFSPWRTTALPPIWPEVSAYTNFQRRASQR